MLCYLIRRHHEWELNSCVAKKTKNKKTERMRDGEEQLLVILWVTVHRLWQWSQEQLLADLKVAYVPLMMMMVTGPSAEFA